MRKLLVFLLLAFVFSIPANAQNLKLGHINTTELFTAMPQVDSMKVAMAAFEKDNYEIFEGMKTEYNKKLEDFSANQEKWSTVVKENKQTEIIELQQRMTVFNQNYEQRMQQEQEKLFTPIREKVKNAIDKVAKAGGFTYVFDIAAGNPIYASETQGTDILPSVKKELGLK